MIADVRLVRDRLDRWRVRINGVRVDLGEHACPAAALVALARAIEGRAWSSRRTTSEEIGHVGEWRS